MPNPFCSMTALRYTLDVSSTVRVRIYNQAGRVVRVISEGERAPGRYTLTWDGRDFAGRMLANGVYVAEIAVNRAVYARRLVLIK
jgi:flagellar hook assembly protein FlgD